MRGLYPFGAGITNEYEEVIIHSQEWSCLWRRCYNNSTWNRCKSHKVIWVIEIYSWGMEDRGLGLSITFTTWSDRINYYSQVICNVENGYHIQLKRVVLLLVRAQLWLLDNKTLGSGFCWHWKVCVFNGSSPSQVNGNW